MKHKIFKVKNNPIDFQEKKAQTPIRQNTEAHFNNQFTQMIHLLSTFIKKADSTSSQQNIQQFQLQPRDRLPLIDPLKYVSINEPSEKQLKLWVTTVCKNTFSTTFNYYLTEQLNYEQARSFCSESILHNLIRLAEKVNLKSSDIKMLDKHIQEKVLPYMAKKYPLTAETDINKALEDVLQEINSFDELENDFIYISAVKFHYRKSGNYNDLIMKVINYHLKQIDKPSKYVFSFSADHLQSNLQSNILQSKLQSSHKQPNLQFLSNYKDFQQFMIDLFQSVQNEQWMANQSNFDILNYKNRHIQKGSLLKGQNDKYRQKVRSFTNYRIGRKIGESVELFLEHQILNEHLVIKNHSILRILTKWCEELENKFQNADYMKEHYENIQTLGGDINSLNDFHRQRIDEKMSSEFVAISEYLQKLKANFYEQQYSFIMNTLEDSSCDYIEHYDNVFGKFSIQMVRNLHTYIIKYLNRLIHGLITVAEDWHRESGYKHNYQKWSYPPNLVTFKIGDLVRCKCSSKEKEILAIFKEITRISTNFPDKLKIIRIKNRLRSQTNDILINVKYNKSLIGQIQLAVNTKKQKFAQYSNNFTHYLYELSRCIFGPFSQLASIWKIHDQRSKEFEGMLRVKGRQETELVKSQLECRGGHKWQPYELPFRCSYCNKDHTHNDLILVNVWCKGCRRYKCCRCRMQSMSAQQLKRMAFRGSYQELQGLTQVRKIEMCNYGVYVTIDSKNPELIFFKQFKINGIIYYLSKFKGNIFKIVDCDDKAIQQFFYHNLVFKLRSPEKYIELTVNEVKEDYILPKYIHKTYKSEKEVLFLNQKDIDSTKWANILYNHKYQEQIHKITKLEMRNNQLKHIDFLYDIYPHLVSLNLGHNNNCDISKISSFRQLVYLNLQENGLTQIPPEVFLLSNLQELDIYRNKVNYLGKDIYKLTNLRILNLKYNNITTFTPEIAKLTNLREILLKGTTNLSKIPQEITLLANLEILNVAKCNLTEINPDIKRLTNLKILELSDNLLTQLPDSLCQLTKLQKLKFTDNRIQILPAFIGNLTELRQIFASRNQIKEVHINYSKLAHLIIVYLDYNQISTLDISLLNNKQLRELYLHNNQCQQLIDFAKLNNLTQLSLDVQEIWHATPTGTHKNALVPIEICTIPNLLVLKLRVTTGYIAFPPQMQSLSQLEQLDLANNNLTKLPFEITCLTSLLKLNFSHNLIQQFPVDFLVHLPRLQQINGSFNRLTKVDKQLTSRIKLLILNNNEIEEVEIMHGVRNKTLKRLLLQHNKIKEIPKHLNSLKRLKELDLRFNLIKSLDEDLTKLKNIEEIQFKILGNPIETINCHQFIEGQLSEETKQYIQKLLHLVPSRPAP